MSKLPVENFNPSANGIGFKEKALSKLLVWFHNGEKRTYYSHDKQFKSNQNPEDYGIAKLKKLCYSRKLEIKSARIYDNRDGRELYRFKQGVWLLPLGTAAHKN
ncbi:MAG: hypothetical protein ACO1OF_16320 [Adhaeribacter sp.]